jgi:2-polyprenyl-6-hydroxyphenyl methylase/3-demethylubiquinone-9 3-methyltransferase
MNPVRLQFMREKLVEVGEWEETRAALVAKQRNERVVTLPSRQYAVGGAWLKGQNVLDVGCGGGLLSESLARLGADVLGIDASATNIEMARIHAQQDDRLRSNDNLRYRAVMAEDLLQEQGTGQYEIVCAMEVVEHVKEPALFLNTLADLLKVGTAFPAPFSFG